VPPHPVGGRHSLLHQFHAAVPRAAGVVGMTVRQTFNNATADCDAAKDVTKAVNGGTNGDDDRKTRYNAVACLLGATQET
jgi:predicted chitinase